MTRRVRSAIGIVGDFSSRHQSYKGQLFGVPCSETLNRMARRVVFAFLCGAGLTALLSLVLNFDYVNVFAALLFFGGGFIQALLRGADSPVAILAANFAFYSVIIFALASTVPRIRRTAESRRIGLRLALPVGVLVCLACIPALNPLWPAGMAQLSRQEAQFQEALPLGMDLGQAHTTLRSQGIEFWEGGQKSDGVIFEGPEGTITATSGDTIVSARVPTDARQFPCAYRISVILVFSKARRLTSRYIHRFGICP
jgi:hypothetical protein